MLCEFVTRQNVCTHFSRDILVTFNKSDRLVGTLILKNVLFEGFDYQKFFSNFFQTPRFTHILLKRDWDHRILIILYCRNWYRITCFFYSVYRDLHPHTEREREGTPHTDDNYLKNWNAEQQRLFLLWVQSTGICMHTLKYK